MATSTRADITARVRARLRVKFRDDRDSDPISLNRIIDEVTSEVSRRTRCYQARFTADITGSAGSPMERYCLPELYEIISVMVTLGTDSTANKIFLRQYDIEDANRYMPQWRTSPASGLPSYWIFAPPYIYFYPLPNYSCNAGLVFEGYASPLAPWASQSDSPALPERIMDTIVYGVCGKWALEFPEDPVIFAKAKTNTDVYDSRLGEYEAEINRQHDRARERHYIYY